MSIVSEAMKTHISSLKRMSGVDGVYRRDLDEIEVTGVPGRVSTVGDVVSDLPVIDTDCEWLFDPRDLVMSGQRILPQERDEWEAEVGGERILFKVLPAIQDEDVYSWSNGHRSMIRVSMKSRGVVHG